MPITLTPRGSRPLLAMFVLFAFATASFADEAQPLADPMVLPLRIPAGDTVDPETLSYSGPVDLSTVAIEELPARIAAGFEELPKPEGFFALKDEALAAAHRKADELQAMTWRYLKSGKGDATQRSTMLVDAVRLMNWNRNRFRASEIERLKVENPDATATELRVLLLRYYRPIESSIVEALKSPLPPAIQGDLVYELAQCYVGVVEATPFDQRAARTQFTTLARDLYGRIRSLPGVTDETKRKGTFQAADMSDRVNDRAACKRHALALLENWPASREAAPAFLLVHRSNYRGGRLEDCLSWWHSNQDILTAAAEGKPLPKRFDPQERVPIETGLSLWRSVRNQTQFWTGLCHFALGDYAKAEQDLGEFVVRVNTLIGEGGADPHSKVWAQHVAAPLQITIRDFHNRPEKTALFDLGDGWTNPPVETEGRIFAVLNAVPSRARNRNAPVFETLENLRVKYAERGLECVWICGKMDRRADLFQNHQLVETCAEEFGAMNWFRGILDPNTSTLYHDMAMSDTEVVLWVVDPKRGSLWQLDDPLDWHAGLIESVIVRALDAKDQ